MGRPPAASVASEPLTLSKPTLLWSSLSFYAVAATVSLWSGALRVEKEPTIGFESMKNYQSCMRLKFPLPANDCCYTRAGLMQLPMRQQHWVFLKKNSMRYHVNRSLPQIMMIFESLRYIFSRYLVNRSAVGSHITQNLWLFPAGFRGDTQRCCHGDKTFRFSVHVVFKVEKKQWRS